MTNRDAALAAVETMTAAIAALDADRFTAVYADDARVWHNTTRLEQSKAENTAFLAATMQQFVALEYRSIRRSFTDTGIVQQHVLHATLAEGQVLEIPACLVVEMAGDQVKRIDEYFSAPA